MSAGSKVFLGICTFLPLFLALCLLAMYISILPDMIYLGRNNPDPAELVHLYYSKIFTAKFFFVVALFCITKLSLMIYYIVHAVNHVKRSEGEKIMWILLFIFIGSIPFIIYYFMKIVPMPARNTTAHLSE